MVSDRFDSFEPAAAKHSRAIGDHRLAWTHVQAVRSKHPFIPNKQGVYAFCQVTRSFQLPFKVEVVYIGKAKDLRRRFRQHLSPLSEHNLELFETLRTSDIEFWYATSANIDVIEKVLIEDIQPKLNQRIG